MRFQIQATRTNVWKVGDGDVRSTVQLPTFEVDAASTNEAVGKALVITGDSTNGVEVDVTVMETETLNVA